MSEPRNRVTQKKERGHIDWKWDRNLDQGLGISDQGPQTRDHGPGTRDQGPGTTEQGPWTKEVERANMQGHAPRPSMPARRARPIVEQEGTHCRAHVRTYVSACVCMYVRT